MQETKQAILCKVLVSPSLLPTSTPPHPLTFPTPHAEVNTQEIKQSCQTERDHE